MPMCWLKRGILVDTAVLLLTSLLCLSVEEVFADCISPCSGSLNKQDIFCRGPFLAARWHYVPNVTFETHELCCSVEQVLGGFENVSLTNDTARILKFFNETFISKTGLRSAELTDWTPNPSVLGKIKDEKYMSFARFLNKRWKDLAKRTSDNVRTNASRFSLRWVPHPFIVPGGRFNNYFYWDSFWIIKGLLACGMQDTVHGILLNFVHLIDSLGFVPNCGLMPCSRRSQPPLLTIMVDDYVSVTGNQTFLMDILPKLKAEMMFWETSRTVVVDSRRMFQYNAVSTCPRPEEYLKDLVTAKSSKQTSSLLFKNIHSAAESGLDFSSKWLPSPAKNSSWLLSTIETTNVVPVELNAYVCKTYDLLAKFSRMIGDTNGEREWRKKQLQLRENIEVLLWNSTDGTWFDYDIARHQHRVRFYSTNVAPLWSPACFVGEEELDQVAKYWERSTVMNYPGGVPTSLIDSSQQWDFPNVWAPLLHIVAESFINSGHSKLVHYGHDLVRKFLQSTYNGWKNYGDVYEKYDATRTDGQPGGGGEYRTQLGFGWTNGVILDFLAKYERTITDPVKVQAESRGMDEKPAKRSRPAIVVVIVFLMLTGGFLAMLLVSKSRKRKKTQVVYLQEETMPLCDDIDDEARITENAHIIPQI